MFYPAAARCGTDSMPHEDNASSLLSCRGLQRPTGLQVSFRISEACFMLVSVTPVDASIVIRRQLLLSNDGKDRELWSVLATTPSYW